MVRISSSKFRSIDLVTFALVCAAFIALCSLPTSAAEIEIQLDRESVPAGNGALMALRITAKKHQKPEIPAIENLIVQPRGRSQQVQIINGHITKSVTYNYAIGSQTPGDYQIPAFEIIADGQKLKTQPLKLKVLDASAAQAPAGIPPGSNPADETESPDNAKRFGFLTVEPASNDRKHVYLGEIAPVRIRAWLPQDARVQLRSGIQPEGKAFTLHNVNDRPQQTTEIRDGKRYNVVTWFGGISATKAGSYPASLSLDATVAVRDTSAPRPRGGRGGPFDDPFFNGIFDRTPMIEKNVTLKSEDMEIEVRPLPTEGRPENFSGAVGIFNFNEIEIPKQWKTGEPQQIRAEIGGSGNFSLVDAPGVTPPESWKTYKGRNEFTPGDKASFSGAKTFQFSAVSRKSGNRKLALTFSFFDPENAAYQTVTSTPHEVSVTGADIPDVEPALAPSVDAPKKQGDQWIGQHLSRGATRSLTPLISRPAFAPIMAAAGFLTACGPLIAWFRIRRRNPLRIARTVMEKATRDAIATANRCADANDSAGFYAAARLALQHRLGLMWNQAPQAITLAEVAARVSGDSPVVSLFQEADQCEYSPGSHGDFPTQGKALLEEALASLNPSSATP